MRFASTLAAGPRPASVAAWAQTLTRYAFVTSAGMALVMGFTVQLARVEGHSMAPTLANQDRLLVDRLTYRIGKPTPGDIVMFHVPVAPNRLFVKRIIAEEGDVVLIRTGWDTLWDDPPAYLASQLPGPTAATARWLVERGVVATGSDTMPYERAPGEKPLEVHAILLVESGVFIFETLNMIELSERKAYRFLFTANPLRITGATGSPINPIAIVP